MCWNSGYIMQEAYEAMDEETREDFNTMGNACNDPSCKGDCEGDCYITSWDGAHGPDSPEPGKTLFWYPFGGEYLVIEGDD